MFFCFFLEIFSTLLTMQCPKCLFHMDNHIDQVRCVTYMEKSFKMKQCIKEHLQKRHLFFVLLLVEDFKISYIFYKIKNFQGNPQASIITTCLIKLFRTGPFHKLFSIIFLIQALKGVIFVFTAIVQGCHQASTIVAGHRY